MQYVSYLRVPCGPRRLKTCWVFPEGFQPETLEAIRPISISHCTGSERNALPLRHRAKPAAEDGKTVRPKWNIDQTQSGVVGGMI
jgi:hypothetical protein